MRGGLMTCAAAAAALLLLIAGRAEAEKPGPLIPRSAMMSVDEIRPGMKGIGKSVFAGTRIENFGVTVLGVLRREDFGGDMILVTIDSGPPVTRGYGVVAGMSGSPIYVGGKLIGALAYTWEFSKRPVAGVTPIAQMLEAYQPGSSPVRLEGALKATRPFLLEGQRIERAVVAPPGRRPTTAAANTLALRPVSTPLMVSGLSPRAMSLLKAGLEPLGLTPMAGGGSMGYVETEIVPGAAVGARLMGGDLDITAVGTVTYVRDGVVLAFGHDMASLGSSEMPMVAAFVHGVVPAVDLSFKLASSGQTVGRFTEDRPWCVGGKLGSPPPLIDTRLSVTDLDRKVTRRYGLEVVRNRMLTTMLLTTAVVEAIGSAGPPSEGTTRVKFSLDAEGLPHLERENTYAMEEGLSLLSLLFGSSSAGASATEELGQILDALQNSDFGEAKLSRLGVEVELSKRRRVARLEEVLVDKHKVKPGEEVQVTVTLRSANAGRITRTEKVRIPESCPAGKVQIGIGGGRSAEWLRTRLEVTEPRPQSLAQMVKQMLDRPSNDELVVQVALPTVGIEARGMALRDLPPAVIEALRASVGTRLRPLRDYVETRTRTEWVVSGYTTMSLTVEAEEKDKGGRPPSPQYGGGMLEEMPFGLAGIFSGFGAAARAASGTAAGALAPAAEEEVGSEEMPEMPSWDEVESVGEGEITTAAAAGEPRPTEAPRGEAIGRVASVWRLSEATELAKGRCEGVAVMSNGGLALGPAAQVLGQVTSQCVWPVAVGRDGAVYTGSWADGKLWRIARDGAATVALETEDAAIQAVVVGGDGTVYAAAMPSGAVYRLREGEKPAVLCRLGAPSIWALAVVGSSLWAATGPEGELFRISLDGSVALAFTAADRHIVALAVGPDDTLYLATAPKGKVYAVRPDGTARSVFEIDKSSAQSIAVDAAGNVYVGTSPDGRVLRIGPDGSVRQVLKAKAKHVLALLAGGDGVMYAAAGPEGKLYAIWPDLSWAELYDAKSAFIAGIASDGTEVLYLTAADTGRVVRLDTGGRREGRFISAVRDAGARARWGAVRWRGESPEGSALRVWTRSGDTGYPDKTWSQWELVAGTATAAASPPGRFLQCRVDLEGEGKAAPQVEAVELSYLPANRAPEVTLSSPKGGEIWSGKKTIRWSGRDPDGDRLRYEVLWSADRGQNWTKIEAEVKPEGAEKEEKKPVGEGAEKAVPEGGGKTQQEPKPAAPAPSAPTPGKERRAAVGSPLADVGLEAGGEDGEEPPGEAEVGQETKPEAETKEAPAGAPTGRATSMEWDTAKAADGAYLIKVTVTDAISNPGEARQGESVSRLLLVDNSGPELIVDRARKEGDAPPAELAAFERTTYITSAEFRVDEGEWLAALAKDGMFDGQLEYVVLDEGRLPQGAHQVEVRVRDAAGNTASATLRYTR